MKKAILIFFMLLISMNTFAGSVDIKQLTDTANKGDAMAQFELGHCYDKGNGVAKDYKQAVFWYQKSADQGYANALYELAVCYDEGKGVEQSYIQTLYWYKKAAEQGHVEAQYFTGYNSMEPEQSVYWYQKAAEQGHCMAQYQLGNCFIYGIGVTGKDDEQAVYWWQKAAEQGLAVAQYRIAGCYINGYGITPNFTLAHMWLSLCADQTKDSTTAQDAREVLNKLERKMTEEQIVEAKDMILEMSAKIQTSCY